MEAHTIICGDIDFSTSPSKALIHSIECVCTVFCTLDDAEATAECLLSIYGAWIMPQRYTGQIIYPQGKEGSPHAI